MFFQWPVALLFGCISAFGNAFPSLHGRDKSLPVSPPDSAIKQALNISTGNPSGCGNSTLFFLQPIDHATYDRSVGGNSTFHQQFEVITDYFKPGGPILFFQGTENANFVCSEELAAPAWAKELGALLIVLEHRYFGISTPYGLNYSEASEWPVEALKPLTLENVLLDGVTVSAWAKRYYPGAQDSRVIYISGSYGGTLSTIARVKHPEAFFGAIASSPLTTGLISDPNAPNVYAWGDWANWVYNDYSFEASSRIRSAMASLRAQIATGNFSNLRNAFNLCTTPKSQTDAETVAYQLMAAYIQNLQDDQPAYGFPFQALMNATLALPPDASYLNILNVTVEAFNPRSGLTCFDWDQHFDAGGPYQYLQCVYLPQVNGYTSNSSIWGLNSPILFLDRSKGDKNLLDPWCRQAFNMSSVQGGSAYQASLGLDEQTLKSTSRLLLTDGLLDPVAAAGTPPWYPGQHNMEDSRVYLYSGGAHTTDVVAETPLDPDGVKDARATILNTMQAWLSDTK